MTAPTDSSRAAALLRLTAAIQESIALDERLKAIDASDPDSITDAGWAYIEDVARAALDVRRRILEAARDLGVDVSLL